MTRIQLPAAGLVASALVLALAAAPSTAQAQGNASAAATAMGDNFTALARNFNAIAWNPANLGLSGNSGFTFALSPQFGAGTGPITLDDLNSFAGIVVPQGVRESWLQKVTDNGGQNLSGKLDFTPFAFSLGAFGFSATTTVRANGDLPPAVAELLLFGNAGRTGTAQNYTLENLALDGNATTSFALAYGRKVPLVPLGELAIGVTGKYMLGHGMASIRDNGSTITSNPIQININAPLVVTDTAEFMNNGSGIGFDVGASWQLGKLTTSLVVHDIISTFAWKTDNLYYMPVEATFDQDSSSSEIEDLLPLSSAPLALQQELRARIKNADVTPTVAIGAAWTGFRRVTLAADLRQRFGDGLEIGPKTQIGVGAELRYIPFVPLRAGLTTLGEGVRYSAGLGLEFGVVNFQFATMMMSAAGRNDSGFGFTMSFGGR